jgi:hypothetical protein
VESISGGPFSMLIVTPVLNADTSYGRPMPGPARKA